MAILRNVLAVVAGVLVGGAVNMALVVAGPWRGLLSKVAAVVCGGVASVL